MPGRRLYISSPCTVGGLLERTVPSKRVLSFRKNSKMNNRENPFKIGDKVIFSPAEHTIGWSWSSFDRLRIHPGDIGVVTQITEGAYLYLDDGRGGFHWGCFKKVT